VRAYAVAVGEKLPEAKFRYFDSEGNMKELGTEQLCKGKKVVILAVPGAFTPTCSLKHLPGFVEKAEEIKVIHQYVLLIAVKACIHIHSTARH
jgi:peroxiredoxin